MDTDPRAVDLAARQASEWLERLKNPGPHDYAAFVQWLKTSALNVRELLLVAAIDTALRGADRNRAIDVQDLVSRAGDLVPTPMNASSPPQSPAANPGPARAVNLTGPLPRLRRWKVAAGLAAIGLIALAAVSVDRALRERFIVTEASEWRNKRLSDGTHVTIGPRTHLRVTMGERARKIDLSSGEALFEVAHDAERPFIVHTGKADVRALGTVFAVSDLRGKMLVTVARGDVAVTQSGRAAVRVSDGQQGAVIENQPAVVTVVDPSVELAWARGQLIFSGVTLGEAARQFNRLNRTQLEIVGPQLAARRVFGTFNASDPESFAGVVLRSPYRDGVVQTERRGRIRLASATRAASVAR